MTRHGLVEAEGFCENVVTTVGDRMYAERGAGVAGAPAAPTGMKLGSGTTFPAKSGSGSALAAYLTNSHQALDAGFPSSAVIGELRRLTYQSTWAAGKATTASPITEVVIVNETLTDATSASGATVSRSLLEGSNAIPVKTADQILTLIWTHDLG